MGFYYCIIYPIINKIIIFLPTIEKGTAYMESQDDTEYSLNVMNDKDTTGSISGRLDDILKDRFATRMEIVRSGIWSHEGEMNVGELDDV